MPVTIRTATHQDTQQLIPLMNEYIVDFYKRNQPPKESLKKHIEHLIDNPSIGLQYVAEENHQLIGFATLYFSFSTLSLHKNAVLNDLYVIPTFRGKRVGEQLFKSCINHIKEHNYIGMTWETAHDNIVAQKLYDRMGGQRSQWLHYELNA
ncbi:GNAT family N-acetyltransferase [Priestia filamentosa]|uniref:GNAT family N-acetyltransferase n=1 Tax=Priestia filamentosa TaxID=1402861 RepID=UPI003982F95D